MSVDVDACCRLGGFTLDARFSTDGGLTALFGPSGAGKTTLINVISGLLRPDRAKISIDGRVLVDTDRGVFVPVHRRRLGFVFQEPRLFPHLTVRQNLLFGRWFTPSAERRERVDHVVDLLGIRSLLDRGPALLSGGEKQRVAIGRALLASPELLVMDEPLAGLDEPRKAEILPYIERLRDEIGIRIIYVTHSVAEVTRLATSMVLLSDGRVVATGTVPDIMGRLDLSPDDARYEPGAVLETRVIAHDTVYDLTTLGLAAGELRVPRLDVGVGASLRVRVLATDVVIALKPPDALSALNVLPGRIAEVGPLVGPAVDVRIQLDGQSLLARVTRLSLDRLGLVPGCPVYAIVKAVAVDRRALRRARLRAEPSEEDES